MGHYPRNKQARNDSLVGPDHVGRLGYYRNSRSRRDELQRGLYGLGDQATVAVNSYVAIASAIVAGGLVFTFTCSGPDLWVNPQDANIYVALSSGFVDPQIGPTLCTSKNAPYSLSNDRTILAVTLPAVAAYSIGVNQAITWNFPEVAFRNRAGVLAVASAVCVHSA
jgi:hypothetical protein